MSEIWKRKLRTYFSTFDFDKDGVISRNDWMEMPSRYAELEKAGTQKAEYLKTQFENVWEQFKKHAEIGNKEQMTVDMFIDSIWKQRNDPELMKHFSGLIRGLFDMLDVTCDGCLQEDEHRRLFVQLGVPDVSFTKVAFNAIDVNRDGKLGIDEFVFAFFDFLFSDDEKSPNTLYFGYLID